VILDLTSHFQDGRHEVISRKSAVIWWVHAIIRPADSIVCTSR